MSSTLAVILAALAGVAAALQSAINSMLGRTLGVLGSALLSFLVGAGLAGIAILFFGQCNLARLGSIPPYLWVGGLLGFIIVMGMIVSVPQVGLATAATALVVAQIITAVIVDHFGLLGVNRIPLNPARLAGVALLIASLRLIFR